MNDGVCIHCEKADVGNEPLIVTIFTSGASHWAHARCQKVMEEFFNPPVADARLVAAGVVSED